MNIFRMEADMSEDNKSWLESVIDVSVDDLSKEDLEKYSTMLNDYNDEMIPSELKNKVNEIKSKIKQRIDTLSSSGGDSAAEIEVNEEVSQEQETIKKLEEIQKLVEENKLYDEEKDAFVYDSGANDDISSEKLNTFWNNRVDEYGNKHSVKGEIYELAELDVISDLSEDEEWEKLSAEDKKKKIKTALKEKIVDYTLQSVVLQERITDGNKAARDFVNKDHADKVMGCWGADEPSPTELNKARGIIESGNPYTLSNNAFMSVVAVNYASVREKLGNKLKNVKDWISQTKIGQKVTSFDNKLTEKYPNLWPKLKSFAINYAKITAIGMAAGPVGVAVYSASKVVKQFNGMRKSAKRNNQSFWQYAKDHKWEATMLGVSAFTSTLGSLCGISSIGTGQALGEIGKAFGELDVAQSIQSHTSELGEVVRETINVQKAGALRLMSSTGQGIAAALKKGIDHYKKTGSLKEAIKVGATEGVSTGLAVFTSQIAQAHDVNTNPTTEIDAVSVANSPSQDTASQTEINNPFNGSNPFIQQPAGPAPDNYVEIPQETEVQEQPSQSTGGNQAPEGTHETQGKGDDVTKPEPPAKDADAPKPEPQGKGDETKGSDPKETAPQVKIERFDAAKMFEHWDRSYADESKMSYEAYAEKTTYEFDLDRLPDKIPSDLSECKTDIEKQLYFSSVWPDKINNYFGEAHSTNDWAKEYSQMSEIEKVAWLRFAEKHFSPDGKPLDGNGKFDAAYQEKINQDWAAQQERMAAKAAAEQQPQAPQSKDTGPTLEAVKGPEINPTVTRLSTPEGIKIDQLRDELNAGMAENPANNNFEINKIKLVNSETGEYKVVGEINGDKFTLNTKDISLENMGERDTDVNKVKFNDDGSMSLKGVSEGGRDFSMKFDAEGRITQLSAEGKEVPEEALETMNNTGIYKDLYDELKQVKETDGWSIDKSNPENQTQETLQNNQEGQEGQGGQEGQSGQKGQDGKGGQEGQSGQEGQDGKGNQDTGNKVTEGQEADIVFNNDNIEIIQTENGFEASYKHPDPKIVNITINECNKGDLDFDTNQSIVRNEMAYNEIAKISEEDRTEVQNNFMKYHEEEIAKHGLFHDKEGNIKMGYTTDTSKPGLVYTNDDVKIYRDADGNYRTSATIDDNAYQELNNNLKKINILDGGSSHRTPSGEDLDGKAYIKLIWEESAYKQISQIPEGNRTDALRDFMEQHEQKLANYGLEHNDKGEIQKTELKELRETPNGKAEVKSKFDALSGRTSKDASGKSSYPPPSNISKGISVNIRGGNDGH